MFLANLRHHTSILPTPTSHSKWGGKGTAVSEEELLCEALQETKKTGRLATNPFPLPPSSASNAGLYGPEEGQLLLVPIACFWPNGQTRPWQNGLAGSLSPKRRFIGGEGQGPVECGRTISGAQIDTSLGQWRGICQA